MSIHLRGITVLVATWEPGMSAEEFEAMLRPLGLEGWVSDSGDVRFVRHDVMAVAPGQSVISLGANTFDVIVVDEAELANVTLWSDGP